MEEVMSGPAPPPHPSLSRQQAVWSLELMRRHPRLLSLFSQMTGHRKQLLRAGQPFKIPAFITTPNLTVLSIPGDAMTMG